jgi:quinoprotein glucose dehydrogenase
VNKRLLCFEHETEVKKGPNHDSRGTATRRVLTAGLLGFISVLAALFTGGSSTVGHTGGVADWPAYGRDPGGSRYSPLTEINRNNVKALKVAWTYRTGAAGQKGDSARKGAFEATPILVDRTLYLSTPFSRVIALDPETGMERWTYDPKVDLSQPYSEVTSRGVSTWADRNGGITGRRRIYVATLDARLIALDALQRIRSGGMG